MEEKGDHLIFFQKKSSLFEVSPVNPWRVCLPISSASKGQKMQCSFLMS